MKKFKNLSTSKKILIIYSLLLIILMTLATSHVYFSLVLYEKNQEKTYINNLIVKTKKSANNGNMDKYINISNLKNEEYKDNLKNILINTKISFKEENDIYLILTDETPLFTVKLIKEKEIKRLGLLKFNKLNNNKLELINNNGIYYYEVTIPSNFKLLVNDKEIEKESEKTINEDFEEINNELFPIDFIYKIEGSFEKPEIEIKNNNGDSVKFEIKDNKIISHDFYKTDDFNTLNKKLIKEIDVFDIAEKWSLYLTTDLKGTRSGFDEISKYLIKNSKMYDRAYDWFSGIDKGMVSSHTLKNPTFTNKKASEFEIYSNKSFSCLVHLEKNMIVSGKDKIDTMNDRLYFVYTDNTWKLVDMRYVSE